ncbi:hypothetical protein ABRY23_01665 [Melioribacteraceae bacterium 4301-Me]|uniref:hypothetical protein n=1 Tax=Pyranulibacter aquaticus TaxID=3163344 RepID=UPI00359700FC
MFHKGSIFFVPSTMKTDVWARGAELTLAGTNVSNDAGSMSPSHAYLSLIDLVEILTL